MAPQSVLPILETVDSIIAEVRFFPPTEGCQAGRELASNSAFRESLHTVSNQVILVRIAARDHLFAATSLSHCEEAQLSPFTLVRAGLEACGLMLHLVDPDLRAIDRIARSLRLRFDGLKLQMQLAEELDARGTCQAQIRRLEERAREIGLGHTVHVEKGEIMSVGKSVPKKTQLVHSATKWSTVYPILSAITHADANSIYQLVVEDSHATEGQPAMLPALIQNMLLFAAVTYARTVWHVVGFYGGCNEARKLRLNEAYDAAGTVKNESIRFG